MEIRNMSFSAHVDAKGILSFIKHVSPKAVMLVHGEKHIMLILKSIIESSIVSPCYCPANFESTRIKIENTRKPVEISKHLTKRLKIDQECKLFSIFSKFQILISRKLGSFTIRRITS